MGDCRTRAETASSKFALPGRFAVLVGARDFEPFQFISFQPLGSDKKQKGIVGVPDGIRTRVIAVKGRCPGPARRQGRGKVRASSTLSMRYSRVKMISPTCSGKSCRGRRSLGGRPMAP